MHLNILWAWILEQCNTWQRQCFLNLELFYNTEWKGLHFLTLPHLDLINLAPFQVTKITWFYRDVSVCIFKKKKIPQHPSESISRAESLLSLTHPLRQEEMPLYYIPVNLVNASIKSSISLYQAQVYRSFKRWKMACDIWYSRCHFS